MSYNNPNLAIGRAHTGTRALTVITGNHALTTNTETGEIIAEHNIDTSKNTHPTQTQTPQS